MNLGEALLTPQGVRAGISLFVAGGASHWVDRIAHGRVVDFVTVGVGPVRTGVFNVADTAIPFGALLFICRAPKRPNEPTPLASERRPDVNTTGK